MFEIENKTVIVIITSSLYCNIPAYLSKRLCKPWAPASTPVSAPALEPHPPIVIAEEKGGCLGFS